MRIKAQGILNAAEWVRGNHGEHQLAEILARCSAPVRERYTSAIAIEWHEAEELEEFLRHAEGVLGGAPGTVAKQLGAAGAEANMSGFLCRAAFYVARPEYAMKRVASAWRQFNDEGEMVLSHFTATHSVVEVRGALPPGPLFCATLTGWCEVLGGKVGADSPRARHTACALRGEPHCAWQVTWAGIAGLDPS